MIKISLGIPIGFTHTEFNDQSLWDSSLGCHISLLINNFAVLMYQFMDSNQQTIYVLVSPNPISIHMILTIFSLCKDTNQ